MATPLPDTSKKISYQGDEIDEGELKPGDHIFARRIVFFDTPLTRYQHHGIYVGEKSVVDFKMDSTLKQRPLDEFLGESPIFRVVYNASFLNSLTCASGSMQIQDCLPVEEVLKKVEFYNKNPGKWGKYNLLTNNCEQFCVYCKTGKRVDALANEGQALTTIIQGLLTMGVTVIALKQWARTASIADGFVSILCELIEEYQKQKKEQKEDEDKRNDSKDKGEGDKLKDKGEGDESKDKGEGDDSKDKGKGDESKEETDNSDENWDLLLNIGYFFMQKMLQK